MKLEEERLNLEILKLLMQMAWADHDLSDDEVAHVIEVARNGGLGDKAVGILEERLRGDDKLPPPDLGFLRKHREAALAAAEQVIHADSHVSDDEEHLLAEIRELLGGES
jgi:uncharacterized tellurite resistance protein B-like protein